MVFSAERQTREAEASQIGISITNRFDTRASLRLSPWILVVATDFKNWPSLGEDRYCSR